jgi:hypothetical protein
MDDQLFRAITVPWMSADPVNCVVSEGRGISNIFDNERLVEPLCRNTIDMEGWCCVGLLRAEIAGVGLVAFLVLERRRFGSSLV